MLYYFLIPDLADTCSFVASGWKSDYEYLLVFYGKSEHRNLVFHPADEDYSSIWEFSIVPHSTRSNPTQKPLELVEKIIASHAIDSHPILDLCCGSGTGAIACANQGYSSLSVDLNREQIEKAYHRLEKHLQES